MKLNKALAKAAREIAESEDEHIFTLKLCQLCCLIRDELLDGDTKSKG
jgi:hypothetical protein